MKRRLLVLDAYDDHGRAALASVGARFAGDLYQRTLTALDPKAELEVIRCGPAGFARPADLHDYDGIVWTGSNLTVHRETPAVRDQLTLARAAFDAGVPSFGSCWAVHIAVTAAGGRCAANPRGREYGVARISATQAGLAHPLLAGKPTDFTALTCHEDHVVELGPDTTVLASNEFSPVQAVDVSHGQRRGRFWAVQYHPEYELLDVAQLGRLRGPQLIAQGSFADADELDRALTDLETLHADRSRADLATTLALDEQVLDFDLRTRELRNWLEQRVEPSARR